VEKGREKGWWGWRGEGGGGMSGGESVVGEGKGDGERKRGGQSVMQQSLFHNY